MTPMPTIHRGPHGSASDLDVDRTADAYTIAVRVLELPDEPAGPFWLLDAIHLRRVGDHQPNLLAPGNTHEITVSLLTPDAVAKLTAGIATPPLDVLDPPALCCQIDAGSDTQAQAAIDLLARAFVAGACRLFDGSAPAVLSASIRRN